MEKKEGSTLTREWFRHRCKGVAVGGTYDELEYCPLRENYLLQITRICIEEETNAPTKVRLYVKGHGYPHWVGEEVSVTAGVLYWIEWPTYLAEGETLVARFYGATAGNVLHMLVEGWAYDPIEIHTHVEVTVNPLGM